MVRILGNPIYNNNAHEGQVSHDSLGGKKDEEEKKRRRRGQRRGGAVTPFLLTPPDKKKKNTEELNKINRKISARKRK